MSSNQSDYILETEVCHDGFFQLKRHKVQYTKFDGSKSKQHNREIFVREPTVGAIIYDANNDSVLLTEQFRIGPLENNDHPWIFELPAGIVENNEDKSAAIEREILEETGYECKVKNKIGEFYLSPGGSSETSTLFYCEANLSQPGVHGAPGENEDIKTYVLSLAEAIKLITEKTISATAAVGLLWLKNQQNSIKEEL